MLAFRLLALLVAPFMATGAAQVLWTTAEAGMAPHEALAAIPESRYATLDERSRGRLGTGEELLVVVPSVIVANYEMRVYVYFLDHGLDYGLSRVRLHGSFSSFFQGRRAAEDLIRALRTRYGPETSESEVASPLTLPPIEHIAMGNLVWNLGDVEIDMEYFLANSNEYYTVTITYTPIVGIDNL